MCSILKKNFVILLLFQVFHHIYFFSLPDFCKKHSFPHLLSVALPQPLTIRVYHTSHPSATPLSSTHTACTPSLLRLRDGTFHQAHWPFLSPPLESSVIIPQLCSKSFGNCISTLVFNFQVSICHSRACIFSAGFSLGS